jgi:hypothetical protein
VQADGAPVEPRVEIAKILIARGFDTPKELGYTSVGVGGVLEPTLVAVLEYYMSRGMKLGKKLDRLLYDTLNRSTTPDHALVTFLLREGADPNMLRATGSHVLFAFATAQLRARQLLPARIVYHLLCYGIDITATLPMGESFIDALYLHRSFDGVADARAAQKNSRGEDIVPCINGSIRLIYDLGGEAAPEIVELLHLERWVGRIQQLERYRLAMLAFDKHRRITGLDICVALHNLRLPAPLLIEILDQSIEIAQHTDFRLKWEMVCAVRHFHERRAKSQ